MKRVLYFLWLVVMVTTFTQSGCIAKDSKEQNQKVRPAPDFKLTTLEGKEITLKDFKGKVLILDLWDTWCPPCRMEIPHFIDLYKTYQKKGLEILGVALAREGRNAVIKFSKEYKINYLGAFATQKILDDYGPISGIPTTFVIDQQGRIYRTYVGYRDKSVFENDIKTLLKL